MADFVPVLSPVVFWKIKNYKACDRKSSPAFKSFGLIWKLKFARMMDKSNGEVVQIDLEFLRRKENVQIEKINCEVRIHKNDNISIQTTSVLLNGIKWCVWSYSYYKLCEYIEKYSAVKDDVCFIVKLTPGEESLNEQLFTEELSRQEAMENLPYLTRLTEDFGSLYSNPELCDFELKCEQLSLPVHKAILSARSGYFAALFRSPLEESYKKFVELKNIDPEILELVIRYMYTESLPKLPFDVMCKIYAVADMFLFESLKIKCRSLMINSFVKEGRLSSENDAQKQVKENSQDGQKQELVKQLFSTREWEALSEEFPALVEEMCKPILLGTVKI